MKKYIACAVFNSPRGMIPVHAAFATCDTLEDAEDAITKYRGSRVALQLYIQEIDSEVGLYVIPVVTNAGELIAPRLGVAGSDVEYQKLKDRVSEN